MPSEAWTQSKVAQIAALTRELNETKGRLASAEDAHAVAVRQVRDMRDSWADALCKAGEADRARAKAEQELARLKGQFVSLYQAAQTGVCKKCWKESSENE